MSHYKQIKVHNRILLQNLEPSERIYQVTRRRRIFLLKKLCFIIVCVATVVIMISISIFMSSEEFCTVSRYMGLISCSMVLISFVFCCGVISYYRDRFIDGEIDEIAVQVDDE